MQITLVLGGLSVAFAQTLILPSYSRSSSQLSLSSSLSLSSRNVSSSATVTPTPIAYKSSVSLASTSQPLFTSVSPSLNASNTVPATYENPWAGNFSSPVSPHGSGSAYALQCQNAWFSYTSINSDFLSATASQFYITTTIRSTTVYEIHTLYETSYYTLCDGHPRVITSTPAATTTTTLPPLTSTILAEGISEAQYANPNCTVSWDDCQGLWSRYSSASSVYDSISFNLANTVVQLGPGASHWMVNGVTTTFPTPSPQDISLGTESIQQYYIDGEYLIVTTPPPGGIACDCGYVLTAGGPPVTIQHTVDFTNTPYTPSCRTEKPTCTANQRCQISGDQVEIYWFPPPANATRDLCASTPASGPITSRPPTNFTWTPVTTGPYAVMPGNTTWFSGNVYVSLNRINAECNWSGTSIGVGATHDGQILTMAPSELFSQRAFSTAVGDRSGLVDFEPYAYSFNFEDLIPPYPWSAWKGSFECAMDSCTSINGPYNPWIAVPEAIRRLDPAWATCDLALYGLYDPPIALSTVGNMFATTTKPAQAPQPTPGQGLPQSQVEPTHTPLNPEAPLPWQSNPASPLPPVVNPSPQPNNPPTPQNPNNPPAPQNPSNPSESSQPGNSGPDPQSHNDPFAPQNPSNPFDPSKPGNSDPNPQNPSPQSPNPNPTPGQNNPAPNNPNPPRPGLTPAPVFPDPTTIGIIGTAPIVIDPANPTQISVGTTTLVPGGPGLTVGAGTSISMLDPSHIIISAPGAAAPSTINVPQPIGNGAPVPTAGVVLTMPDGQRVTATAVVGEGQSGARSATSILVSGTLFSEDGPPVTLPNGLVLSEAPGGTGIVVVNPSEGAPSTIPFSVVSGIYSPNTTPAPTAVVTIGGRVYTATMQGGSVIIPGLGLTMTHGGSALTVNRTTVSDAGTGVVVGTSTAVFVTPTLIATATAAATATSKGGKNGALHSGAAERVLGCQWWAPIALMGCFISIL